MASSINYSNLTEDDKKATTAAAAAKQQLQQWPGNINGSVSFPSHKIYEKNFSSLATNFFVVVIVIIFCCCDHLIEYLAWPIFLCCSSIHHVYKNVCIYFGWSVCEIKFAHCNIERIMYFDYLRKFITK